MTAPYTAAELAAIKARAEAATPGPWHVESYSPSEGGWLIADDTNGWTLCQRSMWVGRAEMSAANATFIAACREEVPRLVAELTRARERIETLETVAARIEADAVPHGKRFSVARGLMADLSDVLAPS